MQKYKIVPQHRSMFWQLVQDMALTEQEQAACHGVSIRHVEVTAATNSWEIAIVSQVYLPEELLARTAVHIAARCELDHVDIYQDVINIADSLKAVWDKVVARTAENNITIYQVLRRSQYVVRGSEIRLELPGDFGKEYVECSDTLQRLEGVVEQLLGYHCHVCCEASAEALAEMQQADTTDTLNTPEYRRALRQEIAAEKKTAAKAKAQGGRKPAAKPTAATAKKAPVRQLDQPVVLPAAGNLIFGRGVAGEVRAIDELEGETKNVILEGTIGEGPGSGIKTIKFKTGTQLLTFCIADATNGISCKKFFKPKRGKHGDEEDLETVLGRLKEGMAVRVRGSVRFDTYQNEYVLFVDSLAKREVKQREDHAAEKRVELHAHTTMSDMDAVDSVESLIQTAERWGWPAIAITDHGVVQAFPNAMKCVAKLNIKVIYGMEGYLVQKDHLQKRANHIIMLAKNPNGLRNLYQL
ncbi:MAG: PHP domain-containing protein, partial [Selenomonadaceae bacterium]|nr:PHP domain-containing protein [Selenomonadaceae bacterium]